MATYEFNRNRFDREEPPMAEGHGTAAQRYPRPPAPLAPPHMRGQMLSIAFEDKDVAVFREVFGDEDTAAAAMDILCAAPPEIQILALQILHIIEKGA